MINLFTYGSLMCEDIMFRVAGCRPAAMAARLLAYQRSRLDGVDYPAIFPAPEGEVEGLIYLDLSPEALRRLDIFEGEMYSREVLTVVTAEAVGLPAMGYVLKSAYHRLLTGEEWRLADFLAGGKARFEAAYGGFASLEQNKPAG